MATTNYKPNTPFQNPNNKDILIVLALVILLLSFFYLLLHSNTKEVANTHKCTWEDCEHINKTIDTNTNTNNFVSTWGYEKNTDGYLVEYTHYIHPSWTYEQCEEYIFNFSFINKQC